jgi:hypothetical protein
MNKLGAILLFCLFSTLLFAQTGQEIQPSKLPKTTTDYITKNFPGSTILRAVKVDDPKKEITYVAMFFGADKVRYFLCFDSKGKFIRKGDIETLKQYKITRDPGNTGGGSTSTPPKK